MKKPVNEFDLIPGRSRFHCGFLEVFEAPRGGGFFFPSDSLKHFPDENPKIFPTKGNPLKTRLLLVNFRNKIFNVLPSNKNHRVNLYNFTLIAVK